MNEPSGITVEEVMDIAENLERMKASSNVFAYYDRDDIAQEIRLCCLLVMDSFDPDRVNKKPIQFFNVCTENWLRNLKRNVATRMPKPIDSINKLDDNPMNNLRVPLVTSMDMEIPDNSFQEEVVATDLKNSIESKLPKKLLYYYQLIINGSGEQLTPYVRKKVKDAVAKILFKIDVDLYNKYAAE